MKNLSLVSKITLFVVTAMVACSAVIGIFAYILNRNDSIIQNSKRALAIADVVVSMLDAEQFAEIMRTGEPNDYYYEYTKFLDAALEKCNITYLYILDKNYDDEVVYFAEGYPYEGRPDEPEILLGDRETVDAYAPELFNTLETGEPGITGVYDMGGYGKMVSGFSAVRDGSGNILGVAGVDLDVNDVVSSTRRFGINIVLIAAGICITAGILSIRLIKSIVADLNGIFENINSATGQVFGGTKQIAEGSQTVARASSEQMASIELLLTSVQTLIDNIKQNNLMAKQASDICTDVKEDAEKSNTQMEDMLSAVRGISDANQNIENVVAVIHDISKRTNILALNASVEAARTGEHGRGFAVVAEEVRTLAAKASEAAKNTKGFIANSAEKVSSGLEIAGHTSVSLCEIAEGIVKSAAIVGDMTRLSLEQERHIGKISEDVSQISLLIQQNTAAVEESAAALQEINAQSSILHDMVSNYRVT